MSLPFKIEEKHIKQLDARQMHVLLRRLLYLEAGAIGLPQESVSVSLNINIQDGGEDGRISWNDGPQRTSWIPNRLTLFQSKAGQLGPKGFKETVIDTKIKNIKPRIAEALDKGGAYIVFTSEGYNQKLIDDRIKKIREALHEYGRSDYTTAQINIYDSKLIAEWCNKYVSAVFHVLHECNEIVECMKTWDEWAAQKDMMIPKIYVTDKERQNCIDALRSEFISNQNAIVRVEGLSGLGKTRMVLEAFRYDDDDQTKQGILSNKVVYHIGEPSNELSSTIMTWSRNNMEAIIVVDDCDVRNHQLLSKQIQANGSHLGLITIDFERSESLDRNTKRLYVEKMEKDKIEIILEQTHSSLPVQERKRLSDFSDGFPQIATLLANAQLEDITSPLSLNDDTIVTRLIDGRRRTGQIAGVDLFKVLKCFSIFDNVGFEDEAAHERVYISNNLCRMEDNQVFAILKQQIGRGIITKRGRYLIVSPRPLAIHLASNWWKEHPPETIRSLLTALPERLVNELCARMKMLYYLPEAKEFVSDLCGNNGLFSKEEVLNSELGSRIFLSLVEVDPRSTMDCLYKYYSKKSKEELIALTSCRRNLVWALTKLSWWDYTFEKAAFLLMKLSLAENENWANNATGEFLQLFYVKLSGTQASYDMRFRVIDKALDSEDESSILLGIKALGKSLETMHFSRMGGVEKQGGRPEGQDWYPRTYAEWYDVIKGSLNRLSLIATEDSALGTLARKSIFENVRQLVAIEAEDILIPIMKQLAMFIHNESFELLDELKACIHYDEKGMGVKRAKKLKELLEYFQPDTLQIRLAMYVIRPSWIDLDEDSIKMNTDILAKEMADDMNSLMDNISLLSSKDARNSYPFGEALAHHLGYNGPFVEKNISVLKEIHQNANAAFFGGYLAGLRNTNNEIVEAIIDNVCNDEILVNMLLDLTRFANCTKESLDRIIDAVNKGRISVNSIHILKYGAVLQDVDDVAVYDFIRNMVSFGQEGALLSLDLTMQYLRIKRSFDQKWRSLLEMIVMDALIYDNIVDSMTAYSWNQAIIQIECEKVASFVFKMAIKLASRDYDIWHSWKDDIKGVFYQLAPKYLELCWDAIGSGLLKRGVVSIEIGDFIKGDSFSESNACLISLFPMKLIIAWCEKHPSDGTAILAGYLPLFDDTGSNLSPLVYEILKKFGINKNVTNAVSSNLHSFGSVGSIVPYYKKRLNVVEALKNDHNDTVRSWANKEILNLKELIKFETISDEERTIGIY